MNVQFRLHHIGYLVRDLAEASIFCDRFGYALENGVIEDKGQTAYIQMIRQPGSGCLIELVRPTDPASLLTRALAKGGGLHHLCYEVDNMSHACDHLRDQGMLALADPVPAAAFDGKRIAWFMDRGAMLIELLESDPGKETRERSF
jgi:methylmalonyl-CoA/ethylmalonyl-CoA epimerase